MRREPSRRSWARDENAIGLAVGKVARYHGGGMTPEDRLQKAIELFREAYRRQMEGDLEGAIEHYQRSIALQPTAEAHTFLGWTYSFQGRLEEAIAECKEAIAVDPDFGNPYNDIGSYLIKLERPDEAILWLEAAIKAARYDPRHYPHCNLGQIYWAKGLLAKAREEFERALELAPDYEFARAALAAIGKQLN
jgi:tetratricopeptide (TPR) repeat protein